MKMYFIYTKYIACQPPHKKFLAMPLSSARPTVKRLLTNYSTGLILYLAQTRRHRHHPNKPPPSYLECSRLCCHYNANTPTHHSCSQKTPKYLNESNTKQYHYKHYTCMHTHTHTQARQSGFKSGVVVDLGFKSGVVVGPKSSTDGGRPT